MSLYGIAMLYKKGEKEMKTKIVNLFRFNELDTATQALIVNDNIDMFLMILIFMQTI